MKIIQILACVLTLTTVPAIALESIPETHKEILGALDDYCLKNEYDFSKMDVIMAADKNAKLMPKKMLHATNPNVSEQGKGYGVRIESNVFLVGYVKNGGCSVSGEIPNVDSLAKFLENNLKIGTPSQFSEGAQSTFIYKFKNESFYKGGVIILSIEKFARDGKKVFSVNFIPARVAMKIFGT